MPARVPPPEIPIVSFLSPNKADQGLIDIWNTEVAGYAPLDIGAPHPNSRQYPNFRLGKQAPLQSDEKWVIRTWVTDETSPDWFNYALKFGDEDNQFPIFIRTYRVPRATYVPLTKGEPLKSLYKLTLSDSGSGYTFGTLPNVLFDDTVTPVDEIALAHAVVSPDGTISECVLDFGGIGYVENAGFTVEPPIQGNPASGIGYIQPLTAILTAEQAELYPEDSEFYAQYLKVARVYETIPGPFATNTRIDDDGIVVSINSRRNLVANITNGETLVGGVWTKKTTKDDNNSLIADEVIETRAIPGNPITSDKIDQDGMVTVTVKTMSDASSITPQEAIVGGSWVRTEVDPISDLVAWKVVTSRPIPGNNILETRIDDNGDITSLTRTLVESSTLATTDVISGGVWTRTYETPVNGSKLVATKTVEVRNTQNELPSFSISIPNLIPEKFRPYVPTETDETTEIGTASLPTLGANEFARSEHQLDDYTYRVSVTKIGNISLPVVLTNELTGEEYGGGRLLDIFVLETLGANPLDQGLMVVSSTITDLGIGLQVRETIGSPLANWETLTGLVFDKDMQVQNPFEEEVVDSSYSVPVPTSSDNFVETLNPIDKWRSKRTKRYILPTAISVETAIVEEIDAPFQFPGLIYAVTGGYYRRQASAQLCQHIIRTWWLSSATKPTRGLPGSGADVEVQDIIMDDIIISTLNDVTKLEYSGMCLHDAITTFGTFTYAATTPSASDYIAMIGSEIVVAASIETTEIPFNWKITTKSVVAR